VVFILSTGTPSFFTLHPTTRRDALAHLASWREPDRPLWQGAAPAVPYQLPDSGMWVLGFAAETRLTDAACTGIIWGGTEHVRPGDGLASDRVRGFHLYAPHQLALSRLLACAQTRIYDTARSQSRSSGLTATTARPASHFSARCVRLWCA
jgi:hypothetical protein